MNQNWTCEKCSGMGCIVATDRIKHYIYAFKCPCGAREAQNKNYPLWTDKLRFKYKADFISEPVVDPKQATADQNKKEPEDIPF